jgi:hypothetical protein
VAYISFQPKDYFNTKLYTGTGSTQSISSVGFQPDWVWCKDRTNTYDHVLFDAVRTATKRIISNSNGAETTASTDLTSFDSDGFTVGSGSNINNSGNNFVSWNWKANGQGSSNTDGSINTTYTSVNTTAGFSISKYTGTGSNATVGHGLGVAPSIVLCKNLSASGNWIMYHSTQGATKYMVLNATDAVATATSAWNDTAPTSSVFSVGTGSTVNGSGNNIIAYCFAEKKGFSKFGSYVGNGSSDGSFINLGFKPAFVLIKDYGRAESWYIFDNRRLGYNGAMADFLANTSAAESSSSATLLDLVSNGFKLRGTTDHLNGNGQNFLYMAFAEEPLVSSNGVPATAK